VPSGGHGAEPETPGEVPRAAAGGTCTQYRLRKPSQRGSCEERNRKLRETPRALTHPKVSSVPPLFQQSHIFRILRPGGRLSVADIVLRGSPEALQGFPKSIALRSWCACVSGALVEEEYLATIRDAGFADVRLVGEHAAGVTAVAVTITARKPPEQPLLAS